MSLNRWCKQNNVTAQQFHMARSLLMTGPSAQAPTFRAIRKMIGMLRRGDKPGKHGYLPWRRAKKLPTRNDVGADIIS